MHKVILNPADLYQHEGQSIILLGDPIFLSNPDNSEVIQKKLAQAIKEEVPGFWGYIAYKEDKSIDWTGEIGFTETPILDSSGTALDLIKLIHSNHPEIEANNLKISEHFIDFDDVIFPTPDEGIEKIPQMKVVLFLKSTEGALAFQQVYEETDDDAEDYDFENDWEPVLPEQTPNFSFDRDRLTYFIDLEYPRELFIDQNDHITFGDEEDERFVVKFLTFFRDHQADSNSEALFERVEEKVFGVDQKYRIRIWDENAGNWFRDAEPGDIDPTKRTLLLIHGLFVTADKSFKFLRKKNRLQKEILDKNQYEQVIAFDHPSVFHDIDENVQHIMAELDRLNVGVFSEKVDWIAASRGALVAKHLSNLSLHGGINDRIPMGKGVTVAGGNGARILEFIDDAQKFAKVLKWIFKPLGAVRILAELFQHSAAYVTSRPGIAVMRIGSDELARILEFDTDKEMEILPLVGDFDKTVRIFGRRRNINVIDHIMRKRMGHFNDWVLRCEEQYITSPYDLPERNTRTGDPYEAGDFMPHKVHAVHGKLLKDQKIRKQLVDFLHA